MFKAILLVWMLTGQQYVLAPSNSPMYVDRASCEQNLNAYLVAAQKWVLGNTGVKQHDVQCMTREQYYDAAGAATAHNEALAAEEPA